MLTRRPAHPIVWLAQIALLLSLGVAGRASPAAAPAPDTPTAKYEVRFMEEMIHHHMMAVHMSETCLMRAFHPELQALCQQMKTAQQQEIMTMEQWLVSWYGVAQGMHEMNPGHHNQMQKLAELSGAEFEIEFMQQMIRHHRMAIVKSSQCVQRAYHAELQDLCASIVRTQLTEMEQMEAWLCTWYALCRPRGSS
ncbi:MAG: DUF305 domain-containing protein [Rubrivivax sp.]|jgi:uncharacterized protein (DUF305 family)|nr:DUF305 domain-containing protein [Rubrivivax sp.]